jgi:hypothetical protein
MDAESTARKGAEVADEISKWTVGGGIITMALFPLALPILALTAIAALPLLLPLVPVGVVVAAVYLPIKLVRRLRRRRGPLGPRGRRGAADEKMLRGVELAPVHRHVVE